MPDPIPTPRSPGLWRLFSRGISASDLSWSSFPSQGPRHLGTWDSSPIPQSCPVSTPVSHLAQTFTYLPTFRLSPCSLTQPVLGLGPSSPYPETHTHTHTLASSTHIYTHSYTLRRTLHTHNPHPTHKCCIQAALHSLFTLILYTCYTLLSPLATGTQEPPTVVLWARIHHKFFGH